MDSRLRVSGMTRSGMDGDDDGFRGGGVAFVGDAVDGDEDVGFGEVGRDAGAGNGVGDYGNCTALRVQPMIFFG